MSRFPTQDSATSSRSTLGHLVAVFPVAFRGKGKVGGDGVGSSLDELPWVFLASWPPRSVAVCSQIALATAAALCRPLASLVPWDPSPYPLRPLVVLGVLRCHCKEASAISLLPLLLWLRLLLLMKPQKASTALGSPHSSCLLPTLGALASQLPTAGLSDFPQ